MSFAAILDHSNSPASHDELTLFLAEMGDIRPLHQDKIVRPRDSGNSEALEARRAAAEKPLDQDPDYFSMEAVPLCDPHDLLAYKKEGVQEGVFKKLRLGHYELQSSLDLHGQSLRQARASLLQFLQDCQRAEVRSVLIRHGRGEHATPKALLKSHVSHWLQQWPEVLAFHSAQRQHGGTGALYLLLRKSERQKIETRERILRHQP